jgi:PTS system nitrogen regulatory IIA component
MQLLDVLARDRVLGDLRAPSKKRVLERAARLLAGEGGAELERAAFEAMVAREHLGSTGLGQGVAIPHGRVAIDMAPTAAFLRLKQPVEFDAPDGEPVDLILALLVPEHFTDQHLSLLAQVAELFSVPEIVAELRSAADGPALYRILAERAGQVSTA